MIERYKLYAYWSARQESVDECSQRAAIFFAQLAKCDSSFTRWFRGGNSRAESLERPVTPDAETLRELLLNGRNRTDSGNEVIEQLGFTFSLWNGESEDDSTVVMIQCGSYSARAGTNLCEVYLPFEGLNAQRVLRTPVLRAVMECVITAWKPDWAVVESNIYRDTVPFPKGLAPRMGWMVYLSNRRGKMPSLPAPVVPLDNLGSLILITEERLTATNPAHVEKAQHIAARLSEAGLLEPLQ